MSKATFSSIIWTTNVKIISMIMANYHISFMEAYEKWINSKTYATLEEQSNEIWQFSNLFLYMLFDEEQKTGIFEIPAVTL